MVKLRLARLGRKKRPFYRLIAACSESPRNSKFLEILGHYDPLKEPAQWDVNSERISYWLSKGAQPSDTVKSYLKKTGLVAADSAA